MLEAALKVLFDYQRFERSASLQEVIDEVLDLNGITAFAAWARRCLGDGWRVVVKQPKPWDTLPSLQGLFAQNGFEAANEPMEEDAE